MLESDNSALLTVREMHCVHGMTRDVNAEPILLGWPLPGISTAAARMRKLFLKSLSLDIVSAATTQGRPFGWILHCGIHC